MKLIFPSESRPGQGAPVGSYPPPPGTANEIGTFAELTDGAHMEFAVLKVVRQGVRVILNG